MTNPFFDTIRQTEYRASYCWIMHNNITKGDKRRAHFMAQNKTLKLYPL